MRTGATRLNFRRPASGLHGRAAVGRVVLRKIAVERRLFSRAARLLARLAEAENNPRIGNNATVILEQEADGGFVAIVPALPGCVSQGDTRDEVMRNIREAADLYIEDCIAAGDPVPTEAGREYFEIKTGTHK